MYAEHNLSKDQWGSLRKYLTPIGALMLSFGFAVGWGAFVMPGNKFLPTAGPLGTALALSVGAITMLAIAWCYHVMTVREPGSGGALAFVRRMFGYDHAFVAGWFLLLTYLAVLWANATALVVALRYLAGDFLQVGWHYEIAGFEVYMGEALASVFALAAVALICIFRKRVAMHFQVAFGMLMIAGISIAVSVALARHDGGLAAMAPAFAAEEDRLHQVLQIVAVAPWLFVGFEAISNSSSEYTFPLKRTFPILISAIVLSALSYIALGLLPVVAHPDAYANWQAYIADLSHLGGHSALPVLAAFEKLMGNFGTGVFMFTMLSALLSGIIAAYIATSRLLHAMSRCDMLPNWFGRLNKDFTPVNAILFILGISSVMPFFGRTVIGWPVDASSIGATLVYGYVGASAFVDSNETKSPVTKVASVVSIFLAVAFSFLLMVPNYLTGDSMAPEAYLLLAVWCLIGFIVYRSAFRRDRQLRFGNSTVVWVALIVMIFFSSLMWIRYMNANVHDELLEHIHGAECSEQTLAREFEVADDSMLHNSIVEFSLLIASLVIMLSLYSILKAKVDAMNKAKSYFFSTVSHDIRTPLNAIIGYSEMFNLGFKTKEEESEAVGSILVSSKALLNLINDVLDISRLESGHMTIAEEPTCCQVLLGEIVKSFKIYNHHHQELDIRCKIDEMPTLLLDPHRLRQIAFNLLANAIKFSESGFVELRARFKQNEDKLTGTFRMDIEDTGCGIAEEDLQKIASPYVQVGSKASRNGGTGLGLAICRQLAVAMGGELTAVSTLGKGSTFTVTLPSVRITSAPPSQASQPSAVSEVAHNIAERDFVVKAYSNAKVKDVKEVVRGGLEEALDAAEKLKPLPTEGAAPEPPPEHAAKPHEESFSPAPAPAPEYQEAKVAFKPRILLADDQKMNLMVLKALLSKLGDFDITLAKNGKEALDALQKPGAGKYDLVLSDMWMPEMNGDGLMKAIKADSAISNLPVYVVTADVEAKNTFSDSGFEGIVLKPVTADKLKAVISRAGLDKTSTGKE